MQGVKSRFFTHNIHVFFRSSPVCIQNTLSFTSHDDKSVLKLSALEDSQDSLRTEVGSSSLLHSCIVGTQKLIFALKGFSNFY